MTTIHFGKESGHIAPSLFILSIQVIYKTCEEFYEEKKRTSMFNLKNQPNLTYLQKTAKILLGLTRCFFWPFFGAP